MAIRTTADLLLEVDIDQRIGEEIWREAAAVTDWGLDVAADFMRAVYLTAHRHALTEQSPEHLYISHGGIAPQRPPVAENLKANQRGLLIGVAAAGLGYLLTRK